MRVGFSPMSRPPLPPEKTRHPLYRRLGGPQGRSGRAENLVPTGIRSRTVQPLAQSLYRLSYRAQSCHIKTNFNFLDGFSKKNYSNFKFHENPSTGSRVVPRGRTANGRFFQFLHNAPERGNKEERTCRHIKKKVMTMILMTMIHIMVF